MLNAIRTNAIKQGQKLKNRFTPKSKECPPSVSPASTEETKAPKVADYFLEGTKFATDELRKIQKIEDYQKILAYSNLFPGILTLVIVIFLLIFLIWLAIQAFFKWISFGAINLPDLPFTLNPFVTQFIYSVFYLVTSAYLLCYIVASHFINLTDETEISSKNLDIFQICNRLIKSLYILWPVSIIAIGSAIAKAFYKMSCKEKNTNINSWAKIVDSFVVLTFVLSVILIIILKSKNFLRNLLSRFSFNYISRVDHESKFLKKLETLFNFDIIYFVLRLILLMYEEFASNNLVFLLGKEGSLIDCNNDDCDTSNFKETFAKIVTGIILWTVTIIVIVIQMLPKPEVQVVKEKITTAVKIGVDTFATFIGNNETITPVVGMPVVTQAFPVGLPVFYNNPNIPMARPYIQ